MTKPSTILRATGEYIAKWGFDPRLEGDTKNCGCFIHAMDHVPESHNLGDQYYLLLLDILGATTLMTSSLRAAGWTGPEVTDDATAACFIAADIAESEGR